MLEQPGAIHWNVVCAIQAVAIISIIIVISSKKIDHMVNNALNKSPSPFSKHGFI